MLQSVNIAGAAIGSLSCAKLLNMSRLKLAVLLNVVLSIGVGISLIGHEVWIIAIGRFIWGIGYGAFSVLSAKFLYEITPFELIGPFGAMSQLSLTFGATLPSSLAFAYPTDIN